MRAKAAASSVYLAALGICAVVLGRGLSTAAAGKESSPQVDLLFPDDKPVGIVYSRPRTPRDDEWLSSYDEWQRVGVARGRFSVPEEHEVRLDVSKEGTDDLRFLSRLPDGTIHFLSLRDTEVTDAVLLHVGSQSALRYLDLDGARITGDGIAFKTLSKLIELRVLRLSAFGVHQDGFGVGDAAMRVISSLPKLQFVGLRLTTVTDTGLDDLCNCKALRHLGLEGTLVTDAGLDHLKRLPDLESLTLGVYDDGALVSDTGLKTIGQLTGLKWLGLSGTLTTDEGLVHLQALEQLEYLSLDNTNVTEDGLAALEPLRSLKKLRFYSRGKRITDQGAKHLAKLKSLTEVAANLNITDEGIAELAKLPRLERLSLSDNATDVSTESIAKMQSLKELWFQDCSITDRGLERLTALQGLERLTLSKTQISGEGLRHLKSFPKLSSLMFSGPEDDDGRPAVDLRHLADVKTLKSLSLYGFPSHQLRHLAGLTGLETLQIGTGELNDSAALQLSQLTNLEYLDMGASTISDAGLTFLRDLQRLENLVIRCRITDKGLDELSRLNNLRYLQIASPDITTDGLKRLQARTPSLQHVNHLD